MPFTADPGQELWREPVPFDYTGDYGVAAASGSSALWLSAPAGVWQAPLPGATDLDVSADVIEASVELADEDGRARLVLRNDPSATSGAAGRYAAYGAGALASLRRGACLALSPGYYGSAGAEASSGMLFWVESVEQVSGPQARLVVQARDAWWLLEQWHARRQYVWTAGSKAVSQILMFICARAGLDYSSSNPSASLTTFKPAFTISPDESGKTAVRRLMALVSDLAIARGAGMLVRNPLAGDSVDYDYGEEHAIQAARYRDLAPGLNRARVLGSAVFNEAFDFAEIESMGEHSAQAVDLNLTTSTLAGTRAAAELRDSIVRRRRDELLLAGLNCAQELQDKITVTDPGAGLTEAPRRVLRLSWRYDTDRGRYDVTLALGEA
jgi:hypothetical protein